MLSLCVCAKFGVSSLVWLCYAWESCARSLYLFSYTFLRCFQGFLLFYFMICSHPACTLRQWLSANLHNTKNLNISRIRQDMTKTDRLSFRILKGLSNNLDFFSCHSLRMLSSASCQTLLYINAWYCFSVTYPSLFASDRLASVPFSENVVYRHRAPLEKCLQTLFFLNMHAIFKSYF